MSLDVSSQVELYDSDILKIEQGPLAWANNRVGSRRNVDDFVNGLQDQFFKIGFYTYVEMGRPVECRCSPPHRNLPDCDKLVATQDDVYFPMVTITGRVTLQAFDYDQMKHEVRNNLLNIPGEGGTIKFDEKDFLRRHGIKHGH